MRVTPVVKRTICGAVTSSPLPSPARVRYRCRVRDYGSCEHALVLQHRLRFNIHHITICDLVSTTITGALHWPLGECPMKMVKCHLVSWRCTSRQEEGRTLSGFLLQSHSVTCFHIKDNTATAFKPNVWCLQPARSILQHRYSIALSLLSL